MSDMGEIVNLSDYRKNSKYGRNSLEPRIPITSGVLLSRMIIDEGKEITGKIVDISAGGLALLVASEENDFERGMEIEKISISGPAGELFETDGRVAHVTQEIAEKDYNLKIGIGFTRKESPTLEKLTISKTDRQFDFLKTEAEMTRILEDLILIGDEATIGAKTTPHSCVTGKFKKGTELKKISSFKIEFEDESHCMNFIIEKEFTFFFTLFRSFYLFRSQVLDNNGRTIEVAIPDFFVKLMRRNTSRIGFSREENIAVSIPHPLLHGQHIKCPIVDMNEQGFAIELDKENCIFPVGISIHELTIEIPGVEPIKTFGRVAHIEPGNGDKTFRCGIKFFEKDHEKLRKITQFVFYNRFPLLFPVDNKFYDQTWELFDKSGYLDEKDRASFELVRTESRPAWEGLDASKGLLSRNVAAKDNERITGDMHLTRIYTDSLLLHHFCILPGHQRTLTTSIYGGMIDQLLDSGAKYAVCYYNADKSWNQKNYGEFINEYPYQDENYIKTYDLFEFDLTKQEFPSSETSTSFTLNEANDFDIKVMARYFELNRKKIQIEAMDLSLESLKMEQLGAIYNKFGLERRRHFFVAKRGRQIAAFSLLDITSTGVNIYALMDSVRVYLINETDPEKEKLIKALTIKSLEYFKSIGKKTVLFYSNDKDISFLSPISYLRLCTIVLWIAHRNCFSRYSEYNGALFGRIIARRKRIHDQAKKI
jgi:hypothetical protein